MKKINHFFEKYGALVFFILTAVHLFTFFQSKFFTTLDGPAHLHNSNLLYHSLFGNAGSFSEYYLYNPSPSPNWISHFFETTFRIFFPPDVTEKIFLSIYFLATVYSFRYLILYFNRENALLGLAVIPFAFSAFLYLGFYNFCFSFCFLFLITGYWLRHRKNMKIKNLILLGFLFLALYLSHGFIYLFSFFVLFLFLLSDFTNICFSQKRISAESFKILFIRGLQVIVSAVPSLLLFLLYIKSYGTSSDFTYLKYDEIVSYLLNIQPLIHFTMEETVYTNWYFYLFLTVFIIEVVLRILKSRQQKLFREADIFLLLACLLLTFIFIAPDSDSKGGFIINRLCMLFYLLLIVWILLQQWNKFLQVCFLLMLLIPNYHQIRFVSDLQKINSAVAADVYKASSHIEDWSVVLPVNKSDNWLLHHFSNYLGVDKPVVVLENYEAMVRYFPLLWNEKNIDVMHMDPAPQAICEKGIGFISYESVKHDYLFFLHGSKSFTPECDSFMTVHLNINYELKYSSQYCSLYKHNNVAEK